MSKCSQPIDEERWRAILGLESAAKGAFFYAVKTTGIFCRPSCKSRKPRRENVAFFLSAVEAEQAGFRPCKRCQPNGISLDEYRANIVGRACRMIDRGLTDLAALARAIGVSPFHFHRIFKAITGITPKAYATAKRSEKMRLLLRERQTVTTAIYKAGFTSAGRFYENAKEVIAMKPNRFRKAQAATIHYGVAPCALGTVLVASSEDGICAVLLGDDASDLIANLQTRFSKSTIVVGARAFNRIVSQVVALIETPKAICKLPLDIQGTVFQRAVWKALREIPAGQTRSYSEIARALGCPKSVRAVAGACGANNIAVIIPCHRVVAANGKLSGYRWGVERKSALLDREKR